MSDPRLACYCFGVAEAELLGGSPQEASELARSIRRRVFAGECDCRNLNPSGRCCLADVDRLLARRDDAMLSSFDLQPRKEKSA